MPNAAELVQHLFFAVATFATLRFLHLLRLGAIPRRSNVLQITVCAMVCLTMIGLFAAIPLRGQTSTNFAVEYADTLAAVAYRAVFYSYLVYCLVGIIIICRRNMMQAVAAHRGGGVSHESTATAISLAFITVGAGLAILASIAGLSTMVLRYLTGQEAQLPGAGERRSRCPGRSVRRHRRPGPSPGRGLPSVAPRPPDIGAPVPAVVRADPGGTRCRAADPGNPLPDRQGRTGLYPSTHRDRRRAAPGTDQARTRRGNPVTAATRPPHSGTLCATRQHGRPPAPEA